MSREVFYEAFKEASKLEIQWPPVYDQFTPAPRAAMAFGRQSGRMVLVWPARSLQWTIISAICRDVNFYELVTLQAPRLYVRLTFEDPNVTLEEFENRAMAAVLAG